MLLRTLRHFIFISAPSDLQMYLSPPTRHTSVQHLICPLRALSITMEMVSQDFGHVFEGKVPRKAPVPHSQRLFSRLVRACPPQCWEQGDPLMPLLLSIGIQGALEEVVDTEEAGEQPCAFIFVLCQPHRVKTICDELPRCLCRVAGIGLHQGKTHVWEQGMCSTR